MDDELREAQRRASGDVEDEARLLAARVRVGDVGLDELALRAYLGDRAAQQVAEAPRGDGRDLVHFVHGLSRWGRRPCVAGALALAVAAQAALGRDDEWQRYRTAAAAALAAAARWLADGRDEDRAAAVAGAVEYVGPPPQVWRPGPARRRAFACHVIGYALEAVHHDDFAERAANAANRFLETGVCSSPDAVELVRAAVRALPRPTAL